MIEIIFLGTSAAIPTKNRNLSSVAIRTDDGDQIIIDAGEDVQRRFQEAGLKFNVETFIFISHLHGDHVIGLPGLLFNFQLKKRTAPLTIIGPEGISKYIHDLETIGMKARTYSLSIIEICLKPFYEDISDEILDKRLINVLPDSLTVRKFESVYQDDERMNEIVSDGNIIFQNSAFSVTTALLNHSLPNFGYRFKFKDYKGKFFPEKAKELNVPQGKLWKQLDSGKTVILEDGTVVDPIKHGIIAGKREGHVITYSGDTTYCENLANLAQNADYLICESTFSSGMEEFANEIGHMTSGMAAKVAVGANVKYLLLTHISSRYQDSEELLESASKIFPNVVIVEDLQKFQISARKT